MGRIKKCPRCGKSGKSKSWLILLGKRRCASCRCEWRANQLPLHLSRAEWRCLLRWFLLGQGVNIIPEEILRGFENDVPYYMMPRYVRFVTEFEKTATMRIIKANLQKEAVTPDTWDRRKAGFKLSRE